jgi:hypothetical protein
MEQTTARSLPLRRDAQVPSIYPSDGVDGASAGDYVGFLMPPSPLTRVRKLCLALPEAHEVVAWGEPTFRVRNKLFAMYAHADNHHGAGRHAVWCKATPMTQDLMIRARPDRYFSPPYVGPSGWVGVVLDGKTDWAALEDLLRDGWKMTAPKKLVGEGRRRSKTVEGSRRKSKAVQRPRKR